MRRRLGSVPDVPHPDRGTFAFTPPADLDPVAPRSLGRLEPVDATTTRLIGSTSNPPWYAQQLAALPWADRIVACPEMRDAARRIGKRLLAASEA